MDRSEFLARPTQAQYEWQDLELGMFFHWFPNADPIRLKSAPEAGKPDMTDPAVQRALASELDCEGFDAKQWVRSALDLGAKYIVFVAKHGPGLCRWRSEFGEYNFTNAPFRNGQGDPLRELADECRLQGVKLGVYLNAASDTYEAAQSGLTRDPAKQAEYSRIYRGWLTEVLTKYGEIVELWFDGSCEIEVGDIFKKYAPNIMVFNSRFGTIRWVGQEEGYASDPAWNCVSRYDHLTGVATQLNGTPEGGDWLPMECDARLRQSWGYVKDLEKNPLHSIDQLMGMYYRSVGHGCNLLINHAPSTDGSILEEDMQRMKEFGDEIRRRFSNPVACGEGRGEVVELDLGGMKKIDHVITMEEIAYGERVRLYCLEGFDGEKWTRLAGGTAIGHKKIDFFAPAEVSRIRVRIMEHVGEPVIRKIAAFFVGETPNFTETKFGESKIGEWGSEFYIDFTTFVGQDMGTAEIHNQARYAFKLAPYLDGAGQYRISFRPLEVSTYSENDPLEIAEAWIEIDGQRFDSYLTRAEDGENEFIVYNNGETNVVFHANSKVFDGWRTPRHAGEVFIRRMI